MFLAPRRCLGALLATLLTLAGTVALAAPAAAAVTGVVHPATLDSPAASDFTWTCTIDADDHPGGVWVTGRSWYDPSRPGFPAVDTPRQLVTGADPVVLTFGRDGDPSTAYGFRCLWFTAETGGTQLGRTPTALFVTTGVDDTPPAAALSGSPQSGPAPLTVTFDASASTDAEGPIAGYTFDPWDNTPTVTQADPVWTHTYTEPGSYVAAVDVVDSAGQHDVGWFEVVVTEPPAPPRPDFGSNAKGKFREAYDPIEAQRVFGSWPPPVWGTGDLAVPIRTVVSLKPDLAQFNAGALDPEFAAWVATIPTDRPVHVLIWHEPEDQIWKHGTFTAAEYRAASIRAHGLIEANKPAGADARLDQNWMSATLNTVGRDWQQLYPDDDADRSNGSPYVGTIWWDNYWGTTDDGSDPPTRMVDGQPVFNDVFRRFGTGGQRDIFAVNVLTGHPLGVAEWGYDHDDTRPGILTQIERFAVHGPGPGNGVPPSDDDEPPVPVVAVLYFDTDTTIATTGDHDLDRADGADRAEWARIVAA